MTTFQLTMVKDGITEVHTSGSRLDLIMKARVEQADSAIVINKDCAGKIVWMRSAKHAEEN